jgi:hypothetical protein
VLRVVGFGDIHGGKGCAHALPLQLLARVKRCGMIHLISNLRRLARGGCQVAIRRAGCTGRRDFGIGWLAGITTGVAGVRGMELVLPLLSLPEFPSL